MPLAYETNCAGQRCDERSRCRRFQMRMPRGGFQAGAEPVFDWASFDLERAIFGDCVNFIRYNERRQ